MLLYFFLVTCFSFIFFSKSSIQKPMPPWGTVVALPSSFLALKTWCLSSFLGLFKHKFYMGWYITCSRITQPRATNTVKSTTTLTSSTKGESVGVEDEKGRALSVLDLPELALECVLEKLPPEGLCSMASVCTSLRGRCMSDHLWERHLRDKWGRILGPATYRDWKRQVALRNDFIELKKQKLQGFVRLLSMLWPWSPPYPIRTMINRNSSNLKNSPAPHFPFVDSVISCYLALETGRFCFPAQVYNRENGHVGFMLSCYDADVSYDPTTDTFQACYPPHGRRAETTESGVSWERLRAAPADISSNDLYESDSLNDLHPGDHIEIQWRRNQDFPYGWWYGVVGHLESCEGEESHCWCHKSDTLVLEFRQYAADSRWRRTMICRKSHNKEGNEADGFYGGIRKLCKSEEISRWKQFWPPQVLE